MNYILEKVLVGFRCKKGATAIEYGILAAGLAAGILAIFGSDGVFITALQEKFMAIIDGLNMGGE
ncbi:Flp family type IVb pilin [Vibrio sp. S9_S30]|uniref:Flp family type IVb pilin n=1 Tax=Vibrio sp. S9_S30 TaxID=2720226 RepID=UPI001680E574|nr:Flp family type IVb pilin [Vibrio sp. S9_S30]MBD1556175.1 Flp family type IVb pilin [Vibrio sp. S9_S30]